MIWGMTISTGARADAGWDCSSPAAVQELQVLQINGQLGKELSSWAPSLLCALNIVSMSCKEWLVSKVPA